MRFVSFAVLLACHSSTVRHETASMTPEQVVATASPGDTVSFQGQVFALTFDSVANNDTGIPDDDQPGGYTPLPDRWLLVRTTRPEGVTRDELDAQAMLGEPDEELVAKAWGLGVHLSADAPRPPIGSTVTVTGTYELGTWNGHTGLPMIEDPEVDVQDADLGVAEGDSCARDGDCQPNLICDRETLKCVAPPDDFHWASAWHDVNGACSSDADCPLGQVCDTDYTIPASGDYTVRYLSETDVGRSLCVPTMPSDTEGTCGEIGTPADLQGGRWAEGREVCVEGEVLIFSYANDGDIHVQLTIEEPLVYPSADAPASLAGATTEVAPPYQDPDRPGGGIDAPAVGERIVAIGTYRWDDGHGWFEVHPVKAWLPAD